VVEVAASVVEVPSWEVVVEDCVVDVCWVLEVASSLVEVIGSVVKVDG